MGFWKQLSVVSAGLAVIGGYAANASAQSCEADSDCGAGYVCVEYTYTAPGCDDMGLPDCAPDDFECIEKVEDCKEDPAEVFTDAYCERAPCETDADCGAEMTCMEFTEEWCEGSGWCDETGCYDEEEVCGSDTFRECGYAYEGDCSADADCGPGFTCVETEVCWCTDGDMDAERDMDAADGGPSDDRDGPVIGDECGCEPSGEFYCELQDIFCGDDADCPAGMVCDAGDSATECMETPDGIIRCDTEEAEGRCLPASWIGIGEDGDWDDEPDTGGDLDVDADTDADADVDGGGDEEDDMAGVYGGFDLSVFFNSCSVSAPARSERSGVLDLLLLLTV